MFLRVGFDVTFARMAERDGCPADRAALENRRYYAGQQVYLGACDPEARADLVIDNTAPDSPHLV